MVINLQIDDSSYPHITLSRTVHLPYTVKQDSYFLLPFHRAEPLLAAGKIHCLHNVSFAAISPSLARRASSSVKSSFISPGLFPRQCRTKRSFSFYSAISISLRSAKNIHCTTKSPVSQNQHGMPNEFGVCMVYGRCCTGCDGARQA